MNILNEISRLRVIPVIEIEDVENTIPLAKALISGGLPLAEITFRTMCAEESIRIISSELPEIGVGAGTVVSLDQAKRAVNAGAQFIVSPGFSSDIVRFCLENKVPVFPGAVTPTELQSALQHGVKTIKFFPAESFGGIAYLKSISGPFNTLNFIPTGGINPENIGDYLSFSKVLACGGSWMASKKLISEKKFGEIEKLARAAVDLAGR